MVHSVGYVAVVDVNGNHGLIVRGVMRSCIRVEELGGNGASNFALGIGGRGIVTLCES